MNEDFEKTLFHCMDNKDDTFCIPCALKKIKHIPGAFRVKYPKIYGLIQLAHENVVKEIFSKLKKHESDRGLEIGYVDYCDLKQEYLGGEK